MKTFFLCEWFLFRHNLINVCSKNRFNIDCTCTKIRIIRTGHALASLPIIQLNGSVSGIHDCNQLTTIIIQIEIMSKVHWMWPNMKYLKKKSTSKASPFVDRIRHIYDKSQHNDWNENLFKIKGMHIFYSFFPILQHHFKAMYNMNSCTIVGRFLKLMRNMGNRIQSNKVTPHSLNEQYFSIYSYFCLLKWMHLPFFESGAATMHPKNTKLTINTVRFGIVAELKLSLE